MLLMEIPREVLLMLGSEIVVIACVFTGWECVGERNRCGTGKVRAFKYSGGGVAAT